MQTVYCITGLGADEKVFQFLDLSFAKPVFIKWMKPLQNETLGSYALRLKDEYIHESNPLIIGLSLGGMIASEIAKAIPSAKVIIISSAKTKYELPSRLQRLRYVPLYKILPAIVIRKTLKTQEYFLGADSAKTRNYLKEKIRTTDVYFYRWAIGAIVHWQNKTVSKNIIHIHGRADKLLPLKFTKPDIVVNNGGHLMIIENSEEISMLLQQIFTEKNNRDELNLAL